MYVRGEGVPLDYAEAARLFKKSADQGNPEAQLSLGLLYYNGWGVEQNREEAINWCLMAVDQGDEKAKLVLTSMLKHAKGRQAAGEVVAVK
jgi:TPR repeat protein